MTKKRNIKRKNIRRVMLVVLSIFLLFLAGSFVYFYKNKNEFVDRLITLYNDQYDGTLAYDKVVVRNWSRFPNVALRFENIVVEDTSTLKHLRFKASELDLFVTFESLIKKQVQIRSVRIAEGEVILDDYTPLTEDEIKGIISLPDSLAEDKTDIHNYLKRDPELEIEDLQFKISIEAKNKEFRFHIDEFSSKTRFEDGLFHSDAEMKVDLQSLGFNLNNGTFGNGAILSGEFQAVYDPEDNDWHTLPFDLQIDEQVFKTQIEFLLKNRIEYYIVFENQETQFTPTLNLLSGNILERLDRLDFRDPINTRVSLDGEFVYKGNPLVHVDFSTKNNLLTIRDSIPIDQLNMRGKFVNRFYDDERSITEDLKNFRATLDEFGGNYLGLDFETKDFIISTGPTKEYLIHTEVTAGGSPSEFNSILRNPYLSFDGGEYDISLKLDGVLTSPADLLEKSSGTFRMSNSVLTNELSRYSMPLKELDISIRRNTAQLRNLEVMLNRRDRISLSGQVENVSDLVKETPNTSIESSVVLQSNNVVWKDLNGLFKLGRNDKSKTDKKPLETIKETLKSIYENFNLSLSVSLEKFQVKDISLRNYEGGISFEEENLLRLKETRFDIDGGHMILNATLDLDHAEGIGLDGLLNGKGDVSTLEPIFDKEIFAIQGGTFNMDASLNGNLLQLPDIVRRSTVAFQMYDTEFVYKPLEKNIPVEIIDLDLTRNYATLNKLLVGLGEEDQIALSGKLENLNSLLFDRGRGNVNSQINIYSESLKWDNFLFLFGEKNKKLDSARQKDRSIKRLKNTLGNLYLSFNPVFNVNIDKFQYEDDLDFSQFHSDIYFEDESTLIFKDTRVKYGDRGEVSLQAELDISSELEIPVVAELEIQGVPGDLKWLFNERTFSMQGGKFRLKSSVSGDIMQIDRLIANSNSHLVVQKSALLHGPSGVDIPCRILDVRLKNKNASLDKFIVILPSGREILFSAEMKNASNLFLRDVSDSPSIQSDFKVQSDELIFDEFVALFRPNSNEGTRKRSRSALKEALRDFYARYQPSLKVNIKDFTYDNLSIQNMASGFHFEGEDEFYLENTTFDFYNAPVELDAHFDIGESGHTPFAFGFATEALDLEKLLESFEFFGLESLQKAEKIGGNVTVNTELQGDIMDSTGIDTYSMKGRIDFDISNMRLKGFEPLIEVADKVFKRERFEDIRFAPISDTVYLSENTLEIPRIEIQSTAIQLFVAGHLGFDTADTNIWTSIPLSNLKKRDVANVPDKKGYIESGKTVYVQAKSEEDGTIKYKLYLNPKKYFEERGMLSNYREEIKEYRYQRRKYKRESRRNERQVKKSSDPGKS